MFLLFKDQQHIVSNLTVNNHIKYGLRKGVSMEILNLILIAHNRADSVSNQPFTFTFALTSHNLRIAQS